MFVELRLVPLAMPTPWIKNICQELPKWTSLWYHLLGKYLVFAYRVLGELFFVVETMYLAACLDIVEEISYVYPDMGESLGKGRMS